MRVLLTGASGFIGQAVKRRIAGKHELFCLDRKDIPAAVAWRPEAVIHCAWGGVNQGGRDDRDLQWEGLNLTHRISHELAGRGCRRVVGVGSQAELNQPDSPYAQCKIRAKGALQQFFKSAAWARLYSVYGPGDNPNNFIPYVIRTLLRGEDVPLTNQNIPWDFLYVDDAADALIRLAESDATGEFEIGYGASGYTQNIAQMICDKISPDATLLLGARQPREREIAGLHCNINHIYNATGWLPKVALDEGLDRTIDWFRGHP